MAYGEWCPKCGAEIVSITRGIPSMGTCANGHKTDRRDTLHAAPDATNDEPLRQCDGNPEKCVAIKSPSPSEASVLTARGILDLHRLVHNLAEQGFRIIAVIDTQNGDYHVVSQKDAVK